MIYTPLTKKAMKIACSAHKNQSDKAGMPYILHPYHVAEQMASEVTTCVALLHDVAEDSDVTFEDLEKEGFYPEIIEALKLLTHLPDVEYMDYVSQIKENPVARSVKIADLRHNADLSRLDSPTPEDYIRQEKYLKAIELLK